MFSEMSKVFDRPFITAFLLPAVVYVSLHIILVAVISPFGNVNLQFITELETTWQVSLALAIAVLIGIVLLFANTYIIKLYEGYYFKDNFLRERKRAKLDKLLKEIEEMENRYRKEEDGGEVSTETLQRYASLLRQRREYYPHQRDHVLPTKLGNVIRAFETYTQEMYSMDAIPLWTRLYYVMAEGKIEAINSAKTAVDFFLNNSLLLLILGIEYLLFGLYFGHFPILLLGLLPFPLAWLCYEASIGSAIYWGELVKSAFDIYRKDLLEQMGLRIPSSLPEEKKLWRSISTSLIYWHLPSMESAYKGNNAEAKKNQGVAGATIFALTLAIALILVKAFVLRQHRSK